MSNYIYNDNNNYINLYEKIISTNEFDIYHQRTTDLYKVKLKNNSYKNQIFLHSIKQTNLLTGLTINSNNNEEFIFQASSVTTLNEIDNSKKNR